MAITTLAVTQMWDFRSCEFSEFLEPAATAENP